MLHEPIGVEEVFCSFEILTKSSSDTRANTWHSQVVLENLERKYAMEDLKPSVSYALTVRGRVLLDKERGGWPIGIHRTTPGLSFLMLLLCSVQQHFMRLPFWFTFYIFLQAYRNICAFIAFPTLMPNTFIVHCVDSSLLQNVKLPAVDQFTVLISWEPPAKSYGRIPSCIIEWSRNNERQKVFGSPSGVPMSPGN